MIIIAVYGGKKTVSYVDINVHKFKTIKDSNVNFVAFSSSINSLSNGI